MTGAVCSNVGLIDSLKPEWLTYVLQWQNPNIGCFMAVNPKTEETEMDEDKFINQVKQERLVFYMFISDLYVDTAFEYS